jgi:hypothetical protein
MTGWGLTQLGPKQGKEPRNILPFFDVSLEKQIDIIKAFVALKDQKPALSYQDAASSAQLSDTTVSKCLGFLCAIGVLERVKRGLYTASEWAVEFVRMLAWSSGSDAWAFLAEHLGDTWFVKGTVAAFAVSRSMTEDQLIRALGQAARLSKRDKSVERSIRLLVELLNSLGVIVKDETGNFKLNPSYAQKDVTKKLEVTEEMELVQVEIGGVTYAVEAKALAEFVTSHGKRISKKLPLD